MGVSESRISQVMTAKIKPAVAAAYVLQEIGARYRDEPDFFKLVVDWITL